jgi:hypothetical protein
VGGLPPLLVYAPVETPELMKLLAYTDGTSPDFLLVVLYEESTILLITKKSNT